MDIACRVGGASRKYRSPPNDAEMRVAGEPVRNTAITGSLAPHALDCRMLSPAPPDPRSSGCVSCEVAGVRPQPELKRLFLSAYPPLAQHFAGVIYGSDLTVPVDRPIRVIGGASGQVAHPPNWRSAKTSVVGGAAVQTRCQNGGGPGPSRCRRRDLNPRPTHYECVALPSELRRR